MAQPRNRCWVFTLNNYTTEDIYRIFSNDTSVDGTIINGLPSVMDDAGKPVTKASNITYLVVAREVGESGTPHLQGYVEFKNARTRVGVKKVLGDRINCNIRLGTPDQASNYCKKGAQSHAEWDEFNVNGPNFGLNADFKEYGVRTEGAQGKRTDLIAIRDAISAGTKVSQLAYENPNVYHAFGRTMNYLEDLEMRKKVRTEPCWGTWYFGSTGVGKSDAALRDYDPAIHYLFKNDNGWWDGYAQQPTVIFNDFRGELCYQDMLALCDKWTASVKRRGREPMPFTSTNIIVTSSQAPEDVYWRTDEKDSIEQLLRRFTVIEMTPSYNLEPDGNGGHHMVMTVTHTRYERTAPVVRNPVIVHAVSTHEARLARRDVAHNATTNQRSMTLDLKMPAFAGGSRK